MRTDRQYVFTQIGGFTKNYEPWDPMKNLERILIPTESIVRMFSNFGTLSIACITLLIFIDIINRYLFGFTIQGLSEVSEYLLVVIGFMGLGYAQLTGAHVKIELLSSRLSPGLQKIINIIFLLIEMVFFIMMTWQIGKESYTSWQSKVYHWGVTWQLPTWLAIFVAFIGCVLLIISFLIQLVRNIACSENRQSNGL
jgi:TRAP-type C4-dicarboxylate transport system permease small subunit